MDATGAARKSAAVDLGIQMPEAAKASAVAADSGTMSGPLVPVTGGKDHRAAAAMRWDAVAVGVRLATVLSSLLSLSIMVTAEQRGSLSVFGIQIPLYSKWSFSDSFEYLVGILAAVAAHSLLQLLLSLRKLAQGSPVIPSHSHAWIIFAVLLLRLHRPYYPPHQVVLPSSALPSVAEPPPSVSSTASYSPTGPIDRCREGFRMRRRRAKEVRVFRGMDCPYSGIRGGGRNSHLASLDQMVEVRVRFDPCSLLLGLSIALAT
ncbi:hypothetical protein BHM03_00029907 [Ensete ventricosum]|nr:hypothetical protein BHM03_00029907 [Ensete ventricosum]